MNPSEVSNSFEATYINELFALFKESWGRRKEVNLNLLPINVPVNLDIGSYVSFFCFLLCSSFFCFPFLLCFLSFLFFLSSFRSLSFFLSFPPIFRFLLKDSFSSSLESNLRLSGSTKVIFRKILGIRTMPTFPLSKWVILGWCKGICSFRNLGILRILWEWC